MSRITTNDLKSLYLPPTSSHKGQNGRLLVIGGSHLFHAASLWALKVASRIVDLVHYSSVPENNELVIRLKSEFRDGIVVPRGEVESYVEEDDAILIGPGMVRNDNSKFKIQNLKEIEQIQDEGIQTMVLVNYLLSKYPHKQWVLDAGALQMMDVSLIPKDAILTPHQGEFESLWQRGEGIKNYELRIMKVNSITNALEKRIQFFAKRYNCIVLVKGEIDLVSNRGEECVEISGGNAGMTKGGTGDVLSGLIAALVTKNDPYLATIAGSFINKKAGDSLFKRVGPFFNASDLADEIPKVMKKLIPH